MTFVSFQRDTPQLAAGRFILEFAIQELTGQSNLESSLKAFVRLPIDGKSKTVANADGYGCADLKSRIELLEKKFASYDKLIALAAEKEGRVVKKVDYAVSEKSGQTSQESANVSSRKQSPKLVREQVNAAAYQRAYQRLTDELGRPPEMGKKLEKACTLLL